MKTKWIFLSGFVTGVLFVAGAGVAAYSQRALIFKVKHKLEEYRLAHIRPKKTAVVIADFERPGDLEAWKTFSAELSLTRNPAIVGKFSAKIHFKPTTNASGIVMKKLFQKNRALRDWEGYESLSVKVFNPSDQSLPLKIKIKDRQGGSHTEAVTLRPKQVNRVFITIRSLQGRLKPSRVAQLNFFLWAPRGDHTIVLDDIRLVPQRAFKEEGPPVILGKEFLPKKGEKIYARQDLLDFASYRGKWAQKDGVVRIPLFLSNFSFGRSPRFPVSGGIPIPRGELTSLEGVRLLDHRERPIAAQFKPLGFWPDQSVQWLKVDAQLSIPPNGRQFAYLEYGHKTPSPAPEDRVTVTRSSRGDVTVVTGPLKFTLHAKGFRFMDTVWLDKNKDGRFSDDEKMMAGADMVVRHDGEDYRSSLDKAVSLTVEEDGPMTATIKAEGWYVSRKNKRFCRFVVRLKAFAGQSFVKVYHTFIYTGYPENKEHYLYKGKRLPANEIVEAISLETPLMARGDQLALTLGADRQALRAPLSRRDINIFQGAADTFDVRQEGQTLLKGKRLDGWIDLSGAGGGISVALTELWQQFPKGWRVRSKARVLQTYLWPPWAGDLDLKTTPGANGEDAVARGSAFGLGKTHEMTYYFHDRSFDPQTDGALVKLLRRPLWIASTPEWVADTAVLGRILAYDERLGPAERGMEMLFDWAARQIKDFQWYGMLDYGDTLSWYRQKDGRWGWFPDGRYGWMNNEAMGLHSGMLRLYLRTGKQKYFDLGQSVARHVMDVDTVHYNTVANDPRLRRVIPDDYSRVGSQHRHNADHWGGRNEETSHTNLHGILLYYHMTGYERALDVAKEIGEFFLKRRVTYFRHPDICPQRSIANVLWGDIEMFLTTREPRYKKDADYWADILYKGQRRDGSWPENYNPEARRWYGKTHVLYTLNYTLPALVAYHRATGNKAIREAILAATRYFMDHRPYNPYHEALVYSYYLTGDLRFLRTSRELLDRQLASQRKGDNPIMRGMVYQKAYYIRAIEFLYQWPYAVGAVTYLEKALAHSRVKDGDAR